MVEQLDISALNCSYYQSLNPRILKCCVILKEFRFNKNIIVNPEFENNILLPRDV